VARAFGILDQFSLERPTLTLTEISSGIGLSKTTTHRLLSTLEDLDLIELDGVAHRYRLGLKVFELGSVVLKSMELVSQADPILHRLVEETDETAFLIAPDRPKTLCLRRVDGHHSVRVLFLDVGKQLAYNVGAGPRVLLAQLTPEERARIIADHVERMTPHTLVTLEELEADGREIRELGYAVSREDVSPHACAVGAPVRDHTGTVIAALSISGIVQRFSDEQLPFLTTTVVRASQDLSRRMGHLAGTTPGTTP
jgi:DNA-binding IclR family transcriptional regulator